MSIQSILFNYRFNRPVTEKYTFSSKILYPRYPRLDSAKMINFRSSLAKLLTNDGSHFFPRKHSHKDSHGQRNFVNCNRHQFVFLKKKKQPKNWWPSSEYLLQIFKSVSDLCSLSLVAGAHLGAARQKVAHSEARSAGFIVSMFSKLNSHVGNSP